MPRVVFIWGLVAFAATAAAFSPVHPSISSLKPCSKNNLFAPQRNGFKHMTQSTTALNVVGGDIAGLASKALEVTASSLKSGPWGVAALSGISSVIVTAFTMIRQAYSFSVGYGFSIFGMGLYSLLSFSDAYNFGTFQGIKGSAAACLLMSTLFYGFRLGGFLLFREYTVQSKREQFKNLDKSHRLKRIPLALSVGIFYALLFCPALYALRAGDLAGNLSKISFLGAGVAWFGAILEAVADAQKYVVKGSVSDETTFAGPTGFTYKICRHPNYLGELIFWFGVFLGGAPSFGTQIVPWVSSGFGLFGIYSIMTGATKRLEGKQEEKYKGQEKYDEYVASVKAPLFPFLS
eukprot:scaffold22525_cov42-Attheya_sp.AAC.1